MDIHPFRTGETPYIDGFEGFWKEQKVALSGCGFWQKVRPPACREGTSSSSEKTCKKGRKKGQKWSKTALFEVLFEVFSALRFLKVVHFSTLSVALPPE